MRNRDLLRVVLFFITIGILSGDHHVWAKDFEHFITASGSQLYDGEKEFRFISFNVPNLLCIEDNMAFHECNPWRLPDAYEIEDALQTIKIMGGNVARTYVLTVLRNDDPPRTHRHVTASGNFDEESFRTMDLVLIKANEIGVRLIIPFVDNWRWMGGIDEYAAFRGKSREHFWTDPQIKADFQTTIEYVLNRRNTISGILYKEDKSILAWELGNELREAPPEWIAEMAAFVKSIDSNHLLSDGLQFSHVREDVIVNPNIDILSTHHYEFSARQTVSNIKSAVRHIQARKPYYIGEFGFFNLPETGKILDAVISEVNICGALIWSLRFHNRDGGFYWHSEPSGRSIFKAYHYPGFQSASVYNEQELMRLMVKKGWEIRELKPPATSKPSAPRLLPISDVARISWQGSVGATDYLVERSEDQKKWRVVAKSICEADFPYEPLFNDPIVEIGEQYYYRIIARNEAGQSAPSNVIGPVKVFRKTLTDSFKDKSKIERIRGQSEIVTYSSRSFKEDLHRLAVESDAEITYIVPGKIIGVILQNFIKEDKDDVKIAVSEDDLNYHEITLNHTDCTPANNDYKYWRSILIQSEDIPITAGFIKFKFSQTTQVGKVEIYYEN